MAESTIEQTKELTKPQTTPLSSAAPASPAESATSTLPVTATSTITQTPTQNDSTQPPTQVDTKSASTKSPISDENGKENAADADCKLEVLPDFDTNNDLPSAESISKLGNLTVLDKDGKSIPFKNVYSGPNRVRRVLVVFIRHFFCSVSVLQSKVAAIQ